MPSRELDLSPGSIIHVQGYESGGFAAKNKYLIILGHHDQNTVLAFLLTSRTEYQTTYRARELVAVPVGSLPTLRKHCWIQCFNDVQRLDVAVLTAGCRKGKVHHRGSLKGFLEMITAVVQDSDVLSPIDVEDCIRVLNAAIEPPK